MRRLVLTLAMSLVAVVLGLTGAGSAAYAQGVSPNFTCPDRSVCIFHGTNFDGFEFTYPTNVYGSQWTNITTAGHGAFNLPWGSFNDNSGSSVVFSDGSLAICFAAHTRISPSLSVRNMRWMWIEFGVPDCSVVPPPPPGH